MNIVGVPAPGDEADAAQALLDGRPDDAPFQLRCVTMLTEQFRRSRIRVRPYVAWILAIGVASCIDFATGPAADPTSRLASPAAISVVPASMLTGDALAALGPAGRFTRSVPPLPTSSALLTADQADSALAGFWRMWGGGRAYFAAEQRGAPIRADRLTRCGRPQFAESSFEAPADTASLPLRVTWGPRWIMAFCDGDTVQIVVAVGALATSLATYNFDQATSGATSQLLSAAFASLGIPPGVRYPLDAEEAAVRAAQLTGRRVDSVPRLIIARPIWNPVWALWNVSLEQPVRVRGTTSGAEHMRQALWYGLIPMSRWHLTVADGTDDGTSYVSNFLQRQADGTYLTFPTIFQRRQLPSFAAAEAVSVVPNPAP